MSKKKPKQKSSIRKEIPIDIVKTDVKGFEVLPGKIVPKVPKNPAQEIQQSIPQSAIADVIFGRTLSPQPFQLKVDIAQLKRKSIFLAVPMYGGMCTGMFTRSLCDLITTCVKNGINCQLYFLFNESLITRARNYCADEFMRSQCTHLMFIDSDIGFNANDVIALLAMQSRSVDDFYDDGMSRTIAGDLIYEADENGVPKLDEFSQPKPIVVCPPFTEVGTPYDVIGAVYPKKCISWEKIKLAVDKGAADQNPNMLENFVGDYVFNPKGGNGQIHIGTPAEVAELGTGFMMIRRETFTKLFVAYPEKMYKPDHVRTAAFDGSREIMMYFQAEIDYGTSHDEDCSEEFGQPKGTIFRKIVDANASKRYLSEDYQFCYDCQKIGLKTWICPWMQLKHVGTYIFGGSLAALASIQAPITADPNQLKNMKV